MANESTQANQKPNKQENMLLNLALNIFVPSLLLMKGEGIFAKIGLNLTPAMVLVFALAFPVGYGIWDFISRRKYNVFSVIGFISILATGAIGLMELDNQWIAVKEASIPAIFGIILLISLCWKRPLVHLLLYNEQLLKVDKVDAALATRGNEDAFKKLLRKCTYLFAISFAFSAVLNYVLARIIIQSPPGSSEYTVELGKMQFWSWPVIALPSTLISFAALFVLLRGIKQLTGYTLEQVLVGVPDEDRGEAVEGQSSGKS